MVSTCVSIAESQYKYFEIFYPHFQLYFKSLDNKTVDLFFSIELVH